MRVAKIASLVVGTIAIILGLMFEGMNVAFLVGWAFSVAASANLPSLVMLLFWKKNDKTRRHRRRACWTLIFHDLDPAVPEAYFKLYGLAPEKAYIQFSQPGLFTIPLGFIAVWITSLVTQPKASNLSKVPG